MVTGMALQRANGAKLTGKTEFPYLPTYSTVVGAQGRRLQQPRIGGVWWGGGWGGGRQPLCDCPAAAAPPPTTTTQTHTHCPAQLC